jgi:membrane-bound lytic murein transglycosylase D
MNTEAPVFFRWNGIKAILARKQDNINKLALAAGISKEELMDYNDLRVFDLIVPGQVYYVKSKRRKAKVPFHTVRGGETLWEVAQNYGITLDALLRKNRMNAPEKLAQGRILWLRHIRPEDHPVEFDPTVNPAPAPLPITKPLPQVALASVASVPASAVVTSSSPAIKKDTGALSLPELNEKYADVTANEKAEQITEPLAVDSTAPQTPASTSVSEAASRSKAPAEVIKAPAPVAKAAPITKPITIAKPAKAGTHIVQAKETMYSIAREHGVMVADLKALNPGSEQGLQPGQVLDIPAKGDLHYLTDLPSGPASAKAPAASNQTPTPSNSPASSSSSSYTVVAGDTYYSISRRFGLKVEDLKALNGLSDGPLSIGQVLKVK